MTREFDDHLLESKGTIEERGENCKASLTVKGLRSLTLGGLPLICESELGFVGVWELKEYDF